MPLYEYECEGCGQRFELIRRFSDPPVERCPSCDGPVRKLLSSPAIQFKGSGWYITDYARKGQKEAEAGSSKFDKAEQAESGTSSESSTAKPAKTAAGSSSKDT